MTVNGNTPVIPILLLGRVTYGERGFQESQQWAGIRIKHIRRMRERQFLPVILMIAVGHGPHELWDGFQHIAGGVYG